MSIPQDLLNLFCCQLPLRSLVRLQISSRLVGKQLNISKIETLDLSYEFDRVRLPLRLHSLLGLKRDIQITDQILNDFVDSEWSSPGSPCAIKSLNFSHCVLLSDSSIIPLIKRCASTLTAITLSFAEGVTREAVDLVLKACPHLECFYFDQHKARTYRISADDLWNSVLAAKPQSLVGAPLLSSCGVLCSCLLTRV